MWECDEHELVACMLLGDSDPTCLFSIENEWNDVLIERKYYCFADKYFLLNH